MKDTAKKVLILNNFESPEIQQAIVILRRYDPGSETRIVLEAENTINKYFGRERMNEMKPAGGVTAVILSIGAAVTALAVYGGIELFGRIF